MKQLSRRILLLLALPAMLAVGAQDALAQQEGVSYYYHEWDYDASQGKNRVFNFGAICNNYKVLDANTSLSASKDFGVGDNPEWDNGGYKWVVVKGNVTINTLSVIGEAHLILTDGCKLTCTGGVWLSGSSCLTIYSQSSGENEGQLIVTQSNKGCAGIGSWKQEEANGSPVSMGSLTIHGGKIEATGAQYGAGIGGGEDRGIQSGCTYTQYGGDVRAIGGEKAAGLGGGYAGHQGGEISIYGGKVTATGGTNGAGIGGGDGGDGGHVHVYGSGADVTALGGKNAAGIGGGNSGDGSNWANKELLTVDGGKVTATGGEDGAGIGGGWGRPFVHFDGGLVIVNGGEVIAQGGRDAAGIGTGGNYSLANATADFGIMIVNGGKVSATGGDHAAGIGGGNRSTIQDISESKFEITGGEVIAQGGNGGSGIGGGLKADVHHVIIKGGTVKAIGGQAFDGFCGLGIGGSSVVDINYQPNSKIEISGGQVYAYGFGEEAGIGGTNGISFTGGIITSISQSGKAINRPSGNREINIGSNMRVSNGDSEDALVLVEVGKRVDACNSDKHVAKLEPCDHAAFGSYTYVDDIRHTAHCLYCATALEQYHKYTDGKCACGKEKEVEPQTVSITLYRAKDATSGEYDNGLLLHVVKGEKYTIPTNNAPEGLTFMGWMQDPATAPADYEMRGGEFMNNLVDAGKELTPTTAVNLYARYRYRYTDEWTWSDDWNSATVTIRQGDKIILENMAAEVYDNSVAPTAENPDGTINKTATYAWTKGDDIVYNFSDQRTIANPYVYDIALANETGNAEKITTHDKRLANVTLTGHTLYKDGHWNTLCLPFDVTTASGPLSGDGVSAKVLDGTTSSLDGGTLTLNFTDVASDDVIPAGTPFIIKWTGGSDIVGPVFENVLVQSDLNSETFQGGTFEGSYVPFAITSENINQIAYLGADDVLGYATEARTLKAFRAHFVLPTTVSGTRAMTRAIINYGDGTTAIVSLRDGITERVGSAADGWYDLQGRRLEGRPQAKGIYIRDGKKVVIK